MKCAPITSPWGDSGCDYLFIPAEEERTILDLLVDAEDRDA
jgi:hypothetical protein